MGKTTIEWVASQRADGSWRPGYSFNPWVGCTKISPGCDNCYAESWAHRTGQDGLWQGEPRRTSASNWQQPRKWDRAAADAGERHRVFCASLADVFDNQAEPRWRDDLWHLIEQTPNLDWLLLTKRPQNIESMLPDPRTGVEPWGDGWPNVWLGFSAEDNTRYHQRMPILRAIPARVRFLSYEPALGPIDLYEKGGGLRGSGLHWVIAGGESGPRARIADPKWFRYLRNRCIEANVPFLFKQWGEWAPLMGEDKPDKGDVLVSDGGTGSFMRRVGKKAAGRLLDHREWNQYPLAAARDVAAGFRDTLSAARARADRAETERDALRAELDAATATLEDEQAAYADTLRLWNLAKERADRAEAALAQVQQQAAVAQWELRIVRVELAAARSPRRRAGEGGSR